jgi:hypothetical protein
MLSASALFEKGVKFFKTDCFVLAARIIPHKSCGVYDVFRVHIFMACNVLTSLLVYCSYELFVAFWTPY